jgi:hypothetical protein
VKELKESNEKSVGNLEKNLREMKTEKERNEKEARE